VPDLGAAQELARFASEYKVFPPSCIHFIFVFKTANEAEGAM